MELRPGYKQTEVGEIPEDWEVLALGRRASFKTGPFGSALHKSDYIKNGVPWINPIHIIDGRLIPDTNVTVTEKAATSLNDFRLRAKDIVIARRGDMGRCAVVSESQAGWLCGSGSMIIRCGPSIDPDFVQRVLASPRAIAEIENASVGSTMNNLNQGVLANLKIQCPPGLAEQRAIADALGDVDALLESLGRQIAKQRDLKQAAMQQLLTGQTRLPGFEIKAGYKQTEVGLIPEDWDVRNLGQVAPLQRGFDLPSSQIKEGDVPVVYSNGVENYHNRAMVKGPGVVTGRSGTLGRVHFVESDYWPHNTSLWVTRFNSNVPKFVYYLYASLGFERFASGSGVPTLNRNDAHEFYVSIPHDPQEQAAIAAVLSDMDAAIAALERRRAKTRDLKQAMMQELLTGKTRLR